MDKDTLKKELVQVIVGEAEQLASALSDACERGLEESSPKEFEEDFAGVITAFGARCLGKSLEAMEPEVIAKMKAEPHAMRDAQGELMPVECPGSLHSKGKKPVTWDTTLGKVRLRRVTTECSECGRWFGFLDSWTSRCNS